MGSSPCPRLLLAAQLWFVIFAVASEVRGGAGYGTQCLIFRWHRPATWGDSSGRTAAFAPTACGSGSVIALSSFHSKCV